MKNINYLYSLASLFYSLSKCSANKNFKFIVIQKPLAKNKINEIENFILNNGAKIIDKKLIQITPKLISTHYKKFINKSFFKDLVNYFTGKKVNVWLVEGNEKIQKNMRKKIGSSKVDKNSFREFLVGDKYKKTLKHEKVLDNGIHVSDSPKEGLREAKLWFNV